MIRATNWQQFCCRYKKHVDGNKWIQVDTICIRQHVSWCKRGLKQDCPSLTLLNKTQTPLARFVVNLLSTLQSCSQSQLSYNIRPTRNEWGLVQADHERIVEMIVFYRNQLQKWKGQALRIISTLLYHAAELWTGE